MGENFTWGRGLGKALLTDVERGISEPGGGLSRSRELLLSFIPVDAAEKVIPVSLVATSVTVNKISQTMIVHVNKMHFIFNRWLITVLEVSEYMSFVKIAAHKPKLGK